MLNLLIFRSNVLIWDLFVCFLKHEDNESFLVTLPTQLELISNFYNDKLWAVGDNVSFSGYSSNIFLYLKFCDKYYMICDI